MSGLGDSWVIVIVIGLAAVIFFVFPLTTISGQQDKVTMTQVQSATNDFGDKIVTNARIEQQDLDNFLQELGTMGAYSTEITIDVQDENFRKKEISLNQKIGDDNSTYTLKMTQIQEALNDAGYVELNPGDTVKIIVIKEGTSTYEQLVNALYRFVGNGSKEVASYTGMAT